PAVAISNRKSPAVMGPGSKRRSGDPSKAPPTRAPQARVAARTAARCWGRRPGTVRPARMRVISKPWPVTADSARAVRTIWPPPSPWEPSREMSRDALTRPAFVAGAGSGRVRDPPRALLGYEVPGRGVEVAKAGDVREQRLAGQRVGLGREETLYGNHRPLRPGPLQADPEDRLQDVGGQDPHPVRGPVGDPYRDALDGHPAVVPGLHQILPEVQLREQDVTQRRGRFVFGAVQTATNQRDGVRLRHVAPD